MKLEAQSDRIIIIPESEMEETYLEAVTGLKENGEECQAIRVNPYQLSCWNYLEIKKKEKK